MHLHALEGDVGSLSLFAVHCIAKHAHLELCLDTSEAPCLQSRSRNVRKLDGSSLQHSE